MTVRTLLVGGLVLGLAATGAGSAWAAPPRPAAATSATAAQPATVVPLITGDVVRMTTAAGRPALSVAARDHSGVAGSFRTVRADGDTYVLPAAALPYLGRGLDKALFDVTQLARAGGDRVPVRLTYQTGAAHRPIPGVTITGNNGATADGYIDRAGARLFGQALVAQVRADAAARFPAGAGIFAGLTGFRYAGPGATPPATPRFPMATLRILATGADGQPASFGEVIPVNVDDVRKYTAFPPFISGGEGRISLPVGNYGLLFVTFDFTSEQFVDRLVNVSDYKLTKAQTLSVDFRTASKDVTVDTPRPAVTDDFESAWGRADVTGLTGLALDEEGTDTVTLVDPGLPAKVGQLHWSNRFHRVSPDGAEPYTYDLRFDSPGSIPADLHWKVTAAELTTIAAGYHLDPGIVPPQDSLITRFSFLPWLDFGFQALLPIPAPTARTEYVNGRPDIIWEADFIGWDVFDFDFSAFADETLDANRVYQAGASVVEDWGKAPIAPGLATDLGNAPPDFRFNCPACREDDDIRVQLDPVDTVPGHRQFVDRPQDTPLGPVASTSRIQLFADGTRIADNGTLFLSLDVPVSPAAATYRLVADTTHTAPWTSLSTATHTEWTFGSAHPATATAPASWTCGNVETTTGTCAVLPLLTLRYAAPVDVANTATGGAQHLGLAVAPMQHAPSVPITSVTAEVSFDHGRTWTAATVTGSGGSYDAAYTAPAGSTVSTRVTAHDANGGAITQTIIDAYAVGGAA
jgi:hypothetical protein